MAVLPGALLSVPRVSVEAAKTRANERHHLAVSLPSPHFIDLRAQPKPPCYDGWYAGFLFSNVIYIWNILHILLTMFEHFISNMLF